MSFIAVVVLGRLLIWTLQTNSLTKSLFSFSPKLEELRDCSFCLGFWIFTLLAWGLDVNLLQPVYIPVVSEVLTGLLVSFGVHLAELGWTVKFGVENLGEF